MRRIPIARQQSLALRLPPLIIRVGLHLRQRHVQLIRQMLHRFGKRQMFNLHHKMDDAAARLAAEAVEQLLFRIHRERCGFLSMEGA